MKVYLIFKADFPADFDGELIYATLSSRVASNMITEFEKSTTKSNFHTRTVTLDEEITE